MSSMKFLCESYVKRRFSYPHIFNKCSYFDLEFLAEVIGEKDKNIVFDETLIRCGKNRLDNFSADKDIIQTIFERIYYV